MKYAKLIEKNLYFPPKNKDGVCNYNLDTDRLVADGYKELKEADKLPGYSYSSTYAEDENAIIEVAEVVKTPEDYQREEFEHDYFLTSLGYIKREVIMRNGEIKDFLTVIAPRLKVGSAITTYNADGTENTNVEVTQEFISECDEQLLKDFYWE